MTPGRALEIFVSLAVLAMVVIGMINALGDRYAEATYGISLAILLIVLLERGKR